MESLEPMFTAHYPTSLSNSNNVTSLAASFELVEANLQALAP